MSEVAVRLAAWAQDEAALRAVRTRVFIEEQHVPEELEWDELDPRCVHVVALADDVAVGTGRLTPDGYIGRMAVLPEWRDRGVGARLLETLLDVSRKRGDLVCRLYAQISAMDFYRRFGFEAEGEEFMDAGIPHRTMFLHFEKPAAGTALQGHAELAAGLVDLARSARVEFALYAPDLAPRMTDRNDLVEALRGLALASSRSRIRLLCRDAREAARSGHALLRLATALPSLCHVHQLAPEDDAPEEIFAFADAQAAFRQPRVTSPFGYLALAAPALAREFAERFEPLWERSRPDPEARRLHL